MSFPVSNLRSASRRSHELWSCPGATSWRSASSALIAARASRCAVAWLMRPSRRRTAATATLRLIDRHNESALPAKTFGLEVAEGACAVVRVSLSGAPAATVLVTPAALVVFRPVVDDIDDVPQPVVAPT